MMLTIAKTIRGGWIRPRRALQCLVAGGCGMAAIYAAAAAYLPVVGPSPVRVQSRPPVVRTEVAITAATLSDMNAAVQAESKKASGIQPGDFIGPTIPSDVDLQAVSPAPRTDISGSAAGEPVISPQIVMQLFHDNLNNSGPTNQNGSALVPVTFTPPVPPGQRTPGKSDMPLR